MTIRLPGSASPMHLYQNFVTAMVFINLLFVGIGMLTAWFFIKALKRPLLPLVILLLWTGIQSILAVNGFFRVTDGLPPRMALVLMPVLAAVIFLLLHPSGKRFLQTLDLKWLTLLHTVRLPVEIGLYLLFREGLVPELMTFEGRNFDILAGISAPFIYYLVFIKKKASARLLLIWNIVCLALLMNILVNAVLSIPGPIQQFAFEQPNIAVLDFPVSLLPALIVPLVLLAHVAAISRKSPQGR
ncbi:MAG: hypothetical protein ACO25B_09040 [Chitinophagaceae bacterium]